MCYKQSERMCYRQPHNQDECATISENTFRRWFTIVNEVRRPRSTNRVNIVSLCNIGNIITGGGCELVAFWDIGAMDFIYRLGVFSFEYVGIVLRKR